MTAHTDECIALGNAFCFGECAEPLDPRIARKAHPMTAHTLDNLDQSRGTLNGWVATCSCHNPDGDGVGRADFGGVTALEAVQAWQEHVAQQPDDLTVERVEVDGDGFEAHVGLIPDNETRRGDARVFVQSSIPDETQVTVWLTVEQWDRLRGVR